MLQSYEQFGVDETFGVEFVYICQLEVGTKCDL